MNINLLRTQIEHLNNKYPKIDYGACGTFSYYLSEVLEQYNILHNIIYSVEKNIPPDVFRCEIKFSHIIIKVGNLFIDNKGIYEGFPYGDQELKTLAKSKLFEMLKENRIWNDVFPEIKKNDLAEDILNITLK